MLPGDVAKKGDMLRSWKEKGQGRPEPSGELEGDGLWVKHCAVYKLVEGSHPLNPNYRDFAHFCPFLPDDSQTT